MNLRKSFIVDLEGILLRLQLTRSFFKRNTPNHPLSYWRVTHFPDKSIYKAIIYANSASHPSDFFIYSIAIFKKWVLILHLNKTDFFRNWVWPINFIIWSSNRGILAQKTTSIPRARIKINLCLGLTSYSLNSIIILSFDDVVTTPADWSAAFSGGTSIQTRP